MSDAGQFLGVVSRNAQLLNRIWMREIDHVTTDIESRIAELRRHRLVLVDPEGSIRLTRATRDFLAMGAGSNEKYRSTHDVIADVQRLTALAGDLDLASAQGATAEVDECEAEATELIWTISDTLDAAVADFEAILRNGLGQTGTRELRVRRSAYYAQRIRDLSAGIQKIVSREILDGLSAPACSTIHRLYQRMICDRIGSLVMRIRLADEGITRLITHDREVLLRTRRMRLQLELLRRYGETRRLDALLHADPEDFPLPTGPGCGAFPDPCDDDLFRVREELAAKAAPRKDRLVAQRARSGRRKQLGSEEIEREAIAPEYLVADAFRRGLIEAGTPRSLRDWLSMRPEHEQGPAVFETIMFGILRESESFDVVFVPPMRGHGSMRVNDIVVSVIQ
ncbi:hypothetical protein [Paracoccus sp. ME4]|uniref:hypothetical protein n=1 Tax=Paracoccus sp. ME4 TaxID=3138066 RepID=UPI00398A8A60